MIAFDTNILVYAQEFGEADPRHRRAINILTAGSLVGACMPMQVLGEFVSVCIRKLKNAPEDVIDQVKDYAAIFLCPPTTLADLADAVSVSERFNIQFFDALILTVARRAGATMLLTEDMHDGLEVGGIKVVNPFAAANETFLAAQFGSAL